MSNETEKEELIKQVEWLHKQFKDAAKPFTDRLAKLVALEPSPPLTVDFLNSIPEGVKNAFADAVATGTGIYNAADPARVIPAESILTPPAASGQQEVPQKQALLDALQEYLNARDDDVGPFFVAGAKQRAREAGEELYNLIDAIFAHPAPAQQESATAPAALTDEQVIEIVRTAVKNGSLNWIGFEPDSEGKFTIPFVSQGTLKLASAILATASAAPAEQVGQWLPIESAPKDGTYVLLGAAACGGAWVGKYEEVYQSGYRPENPWQSMMLNTWHLPVKYPYLIPTHWMPLPPAPDAAIAAQQKGGA